MEPYLDERTRRLFVANEAMAYGRGGRIAAARATGMARSTIGRGINELKNGAEVPDVLGSSGRVRRPGGGSKSAEEHQPGLLAALERLVDGAIRGDPETPLRWVSRSQRNIAAALAEKEFKASQHTRRRRGGQLQVLRIDAFAIFSRDQQPAEDGPRRHDDRSGRRNRRPRVQP